MLISFIDSAFNKQMPFVQIHFVCLAFYLTNFNINAFIYQFCHAKRMTPSNDFRIYFLNQEVHSL